MNQMKDTILLAGLGLIGGSIALAIKKNHPGKRIIGIDISDEQAVAALKLGVIDDRADSFISGVKEAATVIIATPVEQTLVMLEELAHSGIEHELLITDVGSTKQKWLITLIKCCLAAINLSEGIRWRVHINQEWPLRRSSCLKMHFIF